MRSRSLPRQSQHDRSSINRPRRTRACPVAAARCGLLLLLLLTLAPAVRCAAAAPGKIELTEVPAYGSTGTLQGRVSDVNSVSDHAVAVYIHVPPYGWWSRPTTADPVTRIGADGTWACDIATGPRDRHAIEILAFLIPAAYQPPVMDANEILPESLYAYPYAQTVRYPSLKFANCDWMVKRVNDLTSPGPNYFSDDPENLWIDDAGRLHLRITRRGEQWYCGAVIAKRNLGYGRYAFTLAEGIKGMDRNAVLTFSTWDDRTPDQNFREMDIEISESGLSTSST